MKSSNTIAGIIVGALLAIQALAADTPAAPTPNPGIAKLAEEMRSSYRNMIPKAGTPDAVRKVRSLQVAASNPKRKIPVRLYFPNTAAAKDVLPVIVFAHGGGFMSGDFDTHDVLVRAMANRVGAMVVAVDYRLAPENPFPAGLEDVYAVTKWAAKNASKFGGDPKRLVVSGDSAGGNLATAAAMLARDRGAPKIAAQWLMYPTVSNKMDTASWEAFGDRNFPTRTVNTNVIAAYVPHGTSPYAPTVAPLWGDLHGLPPALVQVGEFDPLKDENLAYAEALRKAGGTATAVVYKGQMHGFIQFFKDKAHNAEGETALDAGVAFVREELQRR